MTQFNHRQLTDRARLARELHDGIAQDLVGVGYSLDLLLSNPETSTEARSQLRTLRFTITDMIDKVRQEIFYLRQSSVTNLEQDLQDTVLQHCKDLELHIAIDKIPQTLESELSYEIHRIAQEILRNVSQHARAQNLFLSLISKKEGLELLIVDDGVGGAVPAEGRYGIQSIRDRATSIGGVLNIQSDAGGTRVSLRVPVNSNTSE